MGSSGDAGRVAVVSNCHGSDATAKGCHADNHTFQPRDDPVLKRRGMRNMNSSECLVQREALRCEKQGTDGRRPAILLHLPPVDTLFSADKSLAN